VSQSIGWINSRKQQQGFSLPVAIFIIVIMAMIGIGMVQLSNQNTRSSLQEEFSNRAFYAAESGASYALNRLLGAAGNAPLAASTAACTALNGSSLTFNAQGLQGCRTSFQCDVQNAGGATYYNVSSAGRCVAGSIQAQRTVLVGTQSN